MTLQLVAQEQHSLKRTISCYCLSMKLHEGNVFSHVCQAVCSGRSLYRTPVLAPSIQGSIPGSACARPQPWPPLSIQSPTSPSPTCSNLFILDLTVHPPPKPCSNLFSIWGEDCSRVGSWHLTEMPSCYELSLQDEDFINLLSVDLFCLLFEYFIGFETLKMIVYIYKVKINKSA